MPDEKHHGSTGSPISRRSFVAAGGMGLVLSQELIAQASDVKQDENCPFCRISAGKLSAFKVWEDKHFLAFLDHKPITPGHTLLIPKEHYPYLFDMPEKRYGEMMTRLRRLAAPVRTAMSSKRVGVIVEGFGVDHCHVHIVPINGGDELTRRGVAGVTDDEFALVAKKIRAAIGALRADR